jgi:hypothetical protein
LEEWKMAAHYRLNEDDNGFLAAPQGASLLFAGQSGAETFIERAEDTVVRIGMQSVAVVTSNGGTLAVSIEIDGAVAKGQDGPWPIEYQLRASQAVQVLVKAGARVTIKATPTAENAQILRTVVWASDLKPDAAAAAPTAQRLPAGNGAAQAH